MSTHAVSLTYQERPQAVFTYPSVKTSLTEVTHTLPVKPPCRVFFKNEYEQPSGSFKLRGIGHLVGESVRIGREKYPHKKMHVFASSGGNAGLAAAYSARHYGIPCTVIVPTVTKPEVIELLHSFGAVPIISGDNINEADKHCRLLLAAIDAEKMHTIYCHPFDNPLIWEGHSEIINEIYSENQLSSEECTKLKGVVCSVGGGGLYNGIINGLQMNRNNHTGVLLVETDQAPTLTSAVKAGEVVTLKSVKSLATSLACSYLAQESFDNFHNPNINKSYVESIDDMEAVKGSINYYNNFDGRIVEPACGAAVATVFNQMHLLNKHLGHLNPDDIVVVVVCGGSCTDLNGLNYFKSLVRLAHKL